MRRGKEFSKITVGKSQSALPPRSPGTQISFSPCGSVQASFPFLLSLHSVPRSGLWLNNVFILYITFASNNPSSILVIQNVDSENVWDSYRLWGCRMKNEKPGTLSKGLCHCTPACPGQFFSWSDKPLFPLLYRKGADWFITVAPSSSESLWWSPH